MAGNIKGITIEFRGDTTKLDSALRKVNSETKAIDKELRQVDKALKFNPTNVELWRQKQQLLNAKVNETKEKLEALKQAQAKMDSEGVDKTSEEYRNLQREIITTESKLKTYEGQLKQVGNVSLRATSEQFKQLGTNLTSAGEAMKGISIAAAAVTASIGALAYKSGAWADDLSTMSKVYGISTTELQKYSAAADLVDVSVEDIAKSHVKLEKTMYAAANGSESQAEAFDKLGVSVTNSDGSLRSSDEVFQDVIASLGQMENETERDALAQKLLGKSAANLNPLIEDQGETYKNVADTFAKYDLDYVDEETLEKANEFNDQLDTLKAIGGAALMQVGAQLAGYLAPALEKVVGWIGKFAAWVGQLDPKILAIVAAIGGVLAVIAPLLLILGKIAFAISSIMGLMSTLSISFAAIAGPIGIAIAAIAAIIAIGVLLYKNWDTVKKKAVEIKNSVIKTWNSLKTSVISAVTNLKNTVIALWNGLKASVSSIVSALRNAVIGKWNSLRSSVSSIVSSLKNTLSSAWSSIRSTASSVWNSIKNAIVQPIQSAKSTISGIINGIKSLFPINIGRILSNIKVPHFNLNWSSKDFGPLGSIRYPTGFNVSWYAKGGIFDSPTLAGIGEAGPEAVVPLNRFWDEIEKSNAQTDRLLMKQNAILLAVLEELSKEKNFKVDGVWAGRYVNSLVR